MARDIISQPLLPRYFSSPSGQFELVLTGSGHRPSSIVRAELVEVSKALRRSIWSQPLSHEGGPRTALVANNGAVVLVDEWVNVASRRAIVLIGTDGRLLVRYGAYEVFAALGVPRSVVSAAATYGVWMSAEPTLTADGKGVEFRSGGRRLMLRIADGHLAASD